MSLLIDYGVSRRFLTIALSLLAVIYIVRLTPREMVPGSAMFSSPAAAAPAASADAGRVPMPITDRVAMIADSQLKTNTVPLILHFHAVLGPAWPIVFYTSREAHDTLLGIPRDAANATAEGGDEAPPPPPSAIWTRAVASGAVDVRIIPDEFNMTTRHGVNQWLSRPWLWEQLAPAKHVLVFQTDSMICGNSWTTMDDWLEWDFVGAPLHTREKLFNGGLSLRNRTMMMQVLANPANNWEAETAAGTWTIGGEDIWFSRKMDRMGGHLPDFDTAIGFSCQHDWHISKSKHPLGYHKVHKVSRKQLPEISVWCPEIALAAPGPLEQPE